MTDFITFSINLMELEQWWMRWILYIQTMRINGNSVSFTCEYCIGLVLNNKDI